jgi:Uma2 family endonuclease
MATVTSLMTAEEYIAIPDSFDGPTELVKGVLVTMPPPRPRHGELCARISYLIQRFLEDQSLGRVVTNDAGMITERHPDTVRGPDVAYYSFDRVPKGPLPVGLLDVVADLVFEVLSPSDRWSDVQAKVDEYLEAGVLAVCVVDDDTRSIHVLRSDSPLEVFKAADEFNIADILPGFRVPVQRFFE